MSTLFGGDPTTAYDAATKAQQMAFAPVFFQAVRVLRDRGVLEYLNKSDNGASENQIAEKCSLNSYSVRVLLEAGVESGAIIVQGDCYFLSKTGYFLLKDVLTRRNMDFIHDVCYKGLFHLDTAITSGKPAGLSEFGPWETIYEGLPELPEKVQKSWFAFDHFYSDAAFPDVMKILFDGTEKKVLDVGGNTGRFALTCLRSDPKVQVTILDHPGQLAMARKNAQAAGVENRLSGHGLDLLDHSVPFPAGYDIVWMSQFLDCFPPSDIVNLLQRGRAALKPDGALFVMEPFIDRQKHRQARFALVGTSLYFTALANGTSRMYHASEMISFAEEAGLTVCKEWDGIGDFQTVLCCCASED